MKIAIADDHRMFRQGLRVMIERESNYLIVGEASDGRQAIALCREHKPDLILMDLSMPELGGIEATRAILQDNPGIRVVALSMHADPSYVIETLKAGASGYLLKESAIDELLRAMGSVLQGLTYLSPGIADVVVKDYLQRADHLNGSSSHRSLTPREIQVLRQIADGRSTKEIAHSLGVSIKTIETYRQQIMEKLGLRSIAELTKYAIRQGLTSV